MSLFYFYLIVISLLSEIIDFNDINPYLIYTITYIYFIQTTHLLSYVLQTRRYFYFNVPHSNYDMEPSVSESKQEILEHADSKEGGEEE